MDTEKPRLLDPSALGTRDYWDDIYQRELANHADNPNDEGTVWFADCGAEEKMLQYLEDLAEGEFGPKGMSNSSLRMLDLGTGNGHMLFALRDEGWLAELVGVDYSEPSIRLARQIQAARCATDLAEDINFEIFDFLKSSPGDWLGHGFDIVLDKGTFDAISLSSARDANGRCDAEIFGGKVQRLVRQDGFLLVTSCNWTTDELRRWLEGPDLAYHGVIKYPSFKFGGQEGQSVTSVCFRRR